MYMENTNNINQTQNQPSYFQNHNLKYFWSFLPLVLTVLGNLIGGYAVLIPFGFFVILTILDFVVKTNTKTEVKDEKKLSNHILFGVAGLQIAITLSFLANFILGSNNFGLFLPIAILTNGLAVGLAASAGAHELIHRREQNLKDIGTFQLALIGYGHHTIEHIQGHHRNIGYSADPSTCAKNVDFYTYFLHGLVEEFKDGWKYEAERFTKKNLNPNTMENHVFKWTIVSICFALFIFLTCWFVGLVSYLAVALVALAFHGAVVYSQHYGLTREEGARVDDTLSWQTNSLITENFVLGFGNHSDHHTRVTKTYTEIVQKENGPNMPFGYFASLPVAMIPSIWFSTVNPLIPKKD
jgi:alkane 1-monooxygenase